MSVASDLGLPRFHAQPGVEGDGTAGIDPDVVATLAHEIRNILSPLVSSLELLNLGGIDEPLASQARSVIGRQARQLQRLVNDLLDAHRAVHQRIQVIPQMTEVSAVVRAVCNDHGPLFASRGITLIFEQRIDALWLEIDVARLDQALGNLLSNSLKFTDCGGSVHVGLSIDAAGNYAVISVRDTGIGIEPAALHAIFDPHVRESSLRNAAGLGLGLPLVKRLVELHGGQVTAHSDGLRGSEFRILLPLPTGAAVSEESKIVTANA
jgi:signal transduction histidine kinase